MVGLVAFSPDVKTLASSERRDTTIKLWDVATLRSIATFTGHSDWALPWGSFNSIQPRW
ncbi:hypothetical protein [Anabaena sp. CS-542/02]|uniref:hypothetical protein n=1 Tax=Anabaena sp. CS-542/02 TaxID=3021719 RepID=UPI003FA4632D